MAPDVQPTESRIIAEAPPTQCWWLYLLRTAQGALYTGISTNPDRRLRQHSGELTGGARNLRGKGPLQLVWRYPVADRSSASQLEYRIKQLSKTQKEALVQQQWQPDWLPTHAPTMSASTEVA